jgi:hypothetical protein
VDLAVLPDEVKSRLAKKQDQTSAVTQQLGDLQVDAPKTN